MSEKKLSYDDFLSLHEPQLVKSVVPEHYWPILFEKITKEILDAGDSFMIQKVALESSDECNSEKEKDEDEIETNDAVDEFEWSVVVHAENGISLDDPRHIYLIDHAWTYRVQHGRKQLQQIPGLLERMTSLMDIPKVGKSNSQLIDDVYREMWKFNQTYRIGNADMGSEDAAPIWYIMDEFGSRIQHSDEPSIRVVPFCYIPSQISYSILFPVQSLDYGDEVTRDYIQGCVRNDERRKMRLIPWLGGDYKELSYHQQDLTMDFVTSFHTPEILPNPDVTTPVMPSDRKIRIFCNISLIKDKFQTDDDRFEFVEDEDTADVLWTHQHIYDYKSISENKPGCFISQFPGESMLTVKDMMSAIGRCATSGKCNPNTLETTPEWLQTTYNLETELKEFVSYFQQRESRNLDNVWICKPWNLGRGLDIHVTDNLNCILRLPDTGPKITCKYITNPVLLELDDVGAVKYDIRYLVLLQSVKPLKILVHHTFCSRVANKAFSVDDFDDIEKHLSVLAYKGVDIITVLPEDFIKKLEAQNPGHKFADVQDHMFRCIKELFVAATSREHPMGVAHSPQSRAMYGIDFMLKWVKDEHGKDQIQPIINELNYVPDFTRHQWFRKEFVNDVLHALFLDDIKDRPVSRLC